MGHRGVASQPWGGQKRVGSGEKAVVRLPQTPLVLGPCCCAHRLAERGKQARAWPRLQHCREELGLTPKGPLIFPLSMSRSKIHVHLELTSPVSGVMRQSAWN